MTYRVFHHQGNTCRVVFRTTDREAAIAECDSLNSEQIDACGQGSGHFWTTDALPKGDTAISIDSLNGQ